MLLKDHERLGPKGAVNRVKRKGAGALRRFILILQFLVAGFMRNFLYPNGIAVYATDENIIKYAALPDNVVKPQKSSL